jgi:hypothetical protein
LAPKKVHFFYCTECIFLLRCNALKTNHFFQLLKNRSIFIASCTALLPAFDPARVGSEAPFYFYNILNLFFYFHSRRKTTHWTDPHRSMAQGLLFLPTLWVRVAFLPAHAVLARSAMRVVPFLVSTP